MAIANSNSKEVKKIRKCKSNETYSFASVPSWAWREFGAQGYGGGCVSGKAAALAYLKYAFQRKHICGGSLQHPALDMAEQLGKAEDGSADRDGVRGKMVGFFTTIDYFVEWAVKNSKNDIDQIGLEQLLHDLQDAADGGPERRWKEEDKKRRIESARNAANARWAKSKNGSVKA